MRKNFGLIFVWIFLLSFAQARAAESNVDDDRRIEDKTRMSPYRLSFGIHGGLAFSNASVTNDNVSSSRSGFTVGSFLQTAILPGFLYIQPELNYIQKGAENSQFGVPARTRLNYLELPLFVKVRFMIPRIRPFIQAGPSAAYLLNTSLEGAGVSNDVNRFNNLDISAVFGAGLGFQLGEAVDSTEMLISARYSTGLNNIDAGAGSWKSNYFSVLAGLQF